MRETINAIILCSALILLTFLLCGCNTTTFSQKTADGSTISVKNSRVFWATEGYTVSFNTNGASLTSGKSGADSQAIAAAVEGSINALNAVAAKTVVQSVFK